MNTYEFCLFIQQCGRAVAARNFTVKGDDIEDAAYNAVARGMRICKRAKWDYGGVECWGMV